MKRKRILLILLIALVLFLLFELIFRPAALVNSLGSAFYRHKKYGTAAKVFDKRHKPALKGNRAKALYQEGKYDEAETAYSEAQADLEYDAGNAAFQKDDLEKARDKYIQALLKDSKDEDTKANLELTLKRLQKQPQPDQQPQQDEENKRNEDEVRNILDALDQKERQDRKQQQQPKGNGRTRDWW